jgi:calcium-dependent protein kinase
MKKNRYREKAAAALMEQIVSAVAYCHEKGICHRDLKPQNVLFCDESPNSPVKVVDFGISKIFDPSLTNLQKDNQKKNKLKKMDSQMGTLYFISPEILKGSYSEKCDIWSLGIILYYLLCGYPPFQGGNDNILMQEILESKIKFPKEEWKNISESAKDLISKMLCPEKKRISALEVLNHKWFKTKLKKKLEKKITFDFDKLSAYKDFNILKKSILLFLASRLNIEESNAITEIFKKIDEFKTGTIDFDDFKNFVINNQNQEIIGGENDDEIRKKFLEIDVDRNNKIDFTEFLAANMDKAIYKDKEKLRIAFDLFDTDKNGIISKDDIINILKIENLYDAKKLVSDLIEPNDINKDGKIDFDEFCKLME